MLKKFARAASSAPTPLVLSI